MKHEAVAVFYDQIQQKFGNDYESKRWFRSPVTRSHFKMATQAILRVVDSIAYTNCLELGPGAGTWTKLLLTKHPNAKYTVLDISKTMLDIARENLKEAGGDITYIQSDFSTYAEGGSYDFFFSSRALEYIVDKDEAIAKIHRILAPNGQGVIITKNPRYWADKLFMRTIPDLHKNQIAPGALTALLTEKGFTVKLVRPATVTFPLCKSARLNDVVFALLAHSWIAPIHRLFAESYIVHFKKV